MTGDGRKTNEKQESSRTSSTKSTNRKKSGKISCQSFLFRFIPLIDTLVNYKWKEDVSSDVIAGITVAIMQIPQGMAYALLAEVSPVLGIYAAVFPVLVYAFFGPSKHISIGTTSLTCMLAAGAVLKWSSPQYDTSIINVNNSSSSSSSFNNSSNNTNDGDDQHLYSRTDVIMAICMLVGIWQFVLGLIGFGKLAWIMSEVFMSAYTTGAAMHVFTSQLKGVFGVSLPNRNGPLKLIYNYVDLFKELKNTNWASFIISVISIILLVLNNELLKPRLSKKCNFPFPIQLIVVVLGTLFSYTFHFQEKYSVDIVGDIPQGLPFPKFPDYSLFLKVLLDSLVIAVVGYCLCLSMGKLFASKFNYKINGTQEMLSEGVSNILGSFFSCIPVATAMSRTLVQVNVGGKTQLTSIVSASILIVVLLLLGPLFQPLPKACLSAIIIVALKGMFLQLSDFPKYWRNCKIDGLLWLATFFAIILLDIDIGLAAGIAFSLPMIFFHGYKVQVSLGKFTDGRIIPLKKSEDNTTKEEEELENEIETEPEIGMESFERKKTFCFICISGDLSFVNFEGVKQKLEKIESIKHASITICDLSLLRKLDQTAGKSFQNWINNKTIKRIVISPNDQVRNMLISLSVPDELIKVEKDEISSLLSLL